MWKVVPTYITRKFDCASGIKLKNSSNNNIRNNIIHTNGGAGIYLCLSWGAEPVDVGSSYNIITSNIIYSNDGAGIEFKGEFIQ
ncbi:Right handed beta helix region [Candidatus Methanophagaceae archaeon]|nr:Right handed beta helix region [Methanophagales archaeon]